MSHEPPSSASTSTSEDKLKVALSDSTEMKEQGNNFFLQKNWTSAITAYRQALACLPSPPAPKAPSSTAEEQADSDKDQNQNQDQEQTNDGGSHRGATTAANAREAALISEVNTVPVPVPAPAPVTPLERECANARVILYANIAACELKLEAWDAAVKAATSALEEDPHHHKALWRRAKANEAIDSWSSLTAAEKDYKTLTEIVPPSQPLYRDASTILRGMTPRIEAARQRDTEKMIGQLKEVGNSVLGWFGLSTDNFKMTPNGEGGYSMSFVNQP